MKLKRLTSLKTLLSAPKSIMAQTRTLTHNQILDTDPPQDLDNLLCSDGQPEPERQEGHPSGTDTMATCLGNPGRVLSGESRVERAWAHWEKLGRPKLIVAPMVDNSELPFRMLCRKYGAQAAYTPMLHSRIFSENEKYRGQEFTTCRVNSFITIANFSFIDLVSAILLIGLFIYCIIEGRSAIVCPVLCQ